MNLPNLGAAPYVSSATAVRQERRCSASPSASTDRVNALAAQNVVVVDLMCDAALYSAANFSSDGFHPSDQGYALMAELLYPALRTARRLLPRDLRATDAPPGVLVGRALAGRRVRASRQLAACQKFVRLA